MRLGSTLREIRVLPVAVGSSDAAMTMLACLGCELVLVDSPLAPTLSEVEADWPHRAARRAGCGPLVAITDVSGGAVVSTIETLALPLAPYNHPVLRGALADLQSAIGPPPLPQPSHAITRDGLQELAGSFGAL